MIPIANPIFQRFVQVKPNSNSVNERFCEMVAIVSREDGVTHSVLASTKLVLTFNNLGFTLNLTDEAYNSTEESLHPIKVSYGLKKVI